jgi:hypothetical protein
MDKKPGGARKGAGGKKGAPGRKSGRTKAIAKAKVIAKETGKLPHEILLGIARGEPLKVRKLVIAYYKTGPKKGEEKERRWVEEDHWPSAAEQCDAAKAAAPYYAPRLATKEVKPGGNDDDGDNDKPILPTFTVRKAVKEVIVTKGEMH